MNESSQMHPFLVWKITSNPLGCLKCMHAIADVSIWVGVINELIKPVMEPGTRAAVQYEIEAKL